MKRSKPSPKPDDPSSEAPKPPGPPGGDPKTPPPGPAAAASTSPEAPGTFKEPASKSPASAAGKSPETSGAVEVDRSKGAIPRRLVSPASTSSASKKSKKKSSGKQGEDDDELLIIPEADTPILEIPTIHVEDTDALQRSGSFDDLVLSVYLNFITNENLEKQEAIKQTSQQVNVDIGTVRRIVENYLNAQGHQ